MKDITLEEVRKQTELGIRCSKCFIKSESNWLRQELIRLKKQPLIQTGELHRSWDKEMLQRLKEAQNQLSKLRKTTTAELMVENENLKKQLSDLEFSSNQQLSKVNDELTKCKNLIINNKFSAPSITQKEELLKMTVDDLVNLQPQQPKEETKEEEKEEEKEETKGVDNNKLKELFEKEDMPTSDKIEAYKKLTGKSERSYYSDKKKYS